MIEDAGVSGGERAAEPVLLDPATERGDALTKLALVLPGLAHCSAMPTAAEPSPIRCEPRLGSLANLSEAGAQREQLRIDPRLDRADT